MLLTGTFVRSLDEKQRVAIPKLWRDALALAKDSPLFIAPGTEGSLAMYPGPVLESLARRLAAGANSAEGRALNRLFFAQTQPIEVDGQGRVRIPQELIPLAQLEHDVVLLGVQDHVELWDKARWEQYRSERGAQFDAIMDHVLRGPGEAAESR